MIANHLSSNIQRFSGKEVPMQSLVEPDRKKLWLLSTSPVFFIPCEKGKERGFKRKAHVHQQVLFRIYNANVEIVRVLIIRLQLGPTK